MKYWLFKTEPSTYSWDDLKKQPDRTDYWDGIRNYQARNFLRDQVKKGDLVLLNAFGAGLTWGAALVRW